MAGKTFRGVGDDEDPSLSRDAAPLIADEDDAQGLHSGPTVVDDKKVEEVLRKLRSLDKPPGALTGVTQAVTDGAATAPVRIDPRAIPLDSGPLIELDSGPVKVDDPMYPMRSTAIGRSPAAAAAEAAPVTVPADLARGTLFGRSIHLPDVNAPDDLDVEISSAPHFLDGTPAPLVPFPLAEAPEIPPLAPPVAAPVARFHLPFDADSHTQLVDPPPSRALRNTLAFLGGIAIVGGGLWAWSRYGGHREDASPPAAAPPAAATAAAPAVDPMPPPAKPAAPAAAPAEEAPAPAPKAAAAAQPEAEPPKPAAAADEPAPAAKPHAAAVKEPAAHSRRTSASSSRHGSGKATPTASAPPPADEPAKPHKKPSLGEDPDATMAPSD